MTALNFPSSPADGDTFDNYIYDGTKAVWRIQPNIPDISSKFQVSATAPTDPVNGEVWLNSTDGNTYIYYVDTDSSQWIEIGGNTAPPPNISDLNDVEIYEALDGQALVYDSISDKWVNGEGSTVPVLISETAPVSPEVGELWLNSTEAKMYVYYDDGDSQQWVAAVGGTVPQQGKILQVVQTVKTDTFTTSSTSFTPITGLSASITPSSASSKILILAQITHSLGSGAGWGHFALSGGNTSAYVGVASGSKVPAVFGGYSAVNVHNSVIASSINYVDSPVTTSSITYNVITRQALTGTVSVNRSAPDTDDTANVRGASSIILMEVAE